MNYAIYRIMLFPTTLSDPSVSRHCLTLNNSTIVELVR